MRITIRNLEYWDEKFEDYSPNDELVQWVNETFKRRSNIDIGRCEVEGWTPVDVMFLDKLYGHTITRFAETQLLTPPEQITNAEWGFTGNEVVLVGRFTSDGFDALPNPPKTYMISWSAPVVANTVQDALAQAWGMMDDATTNNDGATILVAQGEGAFDMTTPSEPHRVDRGGN